MDTQDLIQHARRLADKAREVPNRPDFGGAGVESVCLQFLRDYALPESSFCEHAEEVTVRDTYPFPALADIIDSVADYVEEGLHGDISPERQAQLDAVSDFLGQADSLLQEKGVHPAAPAMVIGATLEEFLRSWVGAENLSLAGQKPCINGYAQTLRNDNSITKQDIKDIAVWGGLRNYAAHGEWDKVSDEKSIELMLEGVNLFMRKYGAD